MRRILELFRRAALDASKQHDRGEFEGRPGHEVCDVSD
jgi:hypothetical protein